MPPRPWHIGHRAAGTLGHTLMEMAANSVVQAIAVLLLLMVITALCLFLGCVGRLLATHVAPAMPPVVVRDIHVGTDSLSEGASAIGWPTSLVLVALLIAAMHLLTLFFLLPWLALEGALVCGLVLIVVVVASGLRLTAEAHASLFPDANTLLLAAAVFVCCALGFHVVIGLACVFLRSHQQRTVSLGTLDSLALCLSDCALHSCGLGAAVLIVGSRRLLATERWASDEGGVLALLCLALLSSASLIATTASVRCRLQGTSLPAPKPRPAPACSALLCSA